MKPECKITNYKKFASPDGGGFTAKMYINNVHCYDVYQGGYGGGTDNTIVLPATQAIKDNIKLLDDYIETAPPSTLFGITLDMSLEHFTDELIEDLEEAKYKAKQAKKFEKECLTSIAFGIVDADRYGIINYKTPLDKIEPKMLQHMVNNVKKQHCKGGMVILNKNLTPLGINID